MAIDDVAALSEIPRPKAVEVVKARLEGVGDLQVTDVHPADSDQAMFDAQHEPGWLGLGTHEETIG